MKIKKAFTLVEVMIAVGVIAITLTSLIGLLGAITQKLSEVRSQNRAVALISDVEVILKANSFNKVYEWVRSPTNTYVIYFWDEKINPDDLDSTALRTICSEDPGRVKNGVPRKSEIEGAVGEIYRILIYLNADAMRNASIDVRSADAVYGGGALPGDPEVYGEAFVPITVDVHIEPRGDIIDGKGSDSINDQRRVHRDLLIKTR